MALGKPAGLAALCSASARVQGKILFAFPPPSPLRPPWLPLMKLLLTKPPSLAARPAGCSPGAGSGGQGPRPGSVCRGQGQPGSLGGSDQLTLGHHLLQGLREPRARWAALIQGCLIARPSILPTKTLLLQKVPFLGSRWTYLLGPPFNPLSPNLGIQANTTMDQKLR